MSAKFLEGFSGKFAEQWTTTLLTPAFVFWAGGAIAAYQKFGWTACSAWFIPLPEPLQIASLFSIFLTIATSAFIIQRFDLAIIRFLEGYWSKPFTIFSKYSTQREKYRRNRIKAKLAPLNDRFEALNAIEQTQHFQLSTQFNQIPQELDLLPTRLGNILRGAERRPTERYGLDSIVCWSRLWVLLPEAPRTDLSAARTDLNAAARTWLWSVLFVIWWPTLGATWALIGAIGALWIYYTWLLDAATIYAELIIATFDTYRHLLYQSLRFDLPNPKDSNEERLFGKRLTKYLWLGRFEN
jgi:hypothetical protein